MLTAMRKSSDNWFVKIFLGIVVLGFVATGGLLSYSSVQSNNYVASVGETSVTGDEFFTEYSREANRFSQQFGQNLQPEFLKIIEQSVVTRLLNRAALENTGKQLNLAIDDKLAADEITQSDRFKNGNGDFDKAIFDGLLRQNNLTEKDYVQLIKDQKILDQLTDGLANIRFSPNVYGQIISEFNDEERIAEFFHINASNVEIADTPTGDALNTYYKTVIEQFDAPEYRQADMLTLNPEVIAKDMIVDDEEVKAQYELSKNSFNSLEKRLISQLVYNNAEDAAAAYKKTEDGATFAELATELGIVGDAHVIGTFEKATLPNKEMAEVAFSLEENQISAPVDLGLGVAILQVSKITPAVTKTFADVKQDIEIFEALRLANDKIFELRDQVEDEIAGGATFKEIADKLDIEYTAIPSLDSNALDASGKTIELAGVPSLLRNIFASDVLLDNEPIDTANGGIVWYVVNEVILRKNKDLADVTEEVNARWQSEQIEKALIAKADELILKAGDITSLSSGITDAVSVASAVKRSTQSVQLSAQAINALFGVKLGEYAHSASQLNGEKAYIIMQLKEIIAPDTEAMKEQNDQILQSIAPSLASTLLESYIENNKGVYGISVNQDLIDRITGVDGSVQ